MIKDFVQGELKTEIRCNLVFDDGHNNGFMFPCSESGIPILNDCSQKNYEFCIAHPEKFVRFNKVVNETQQYRENNRGTCSCGKKIELYDEYMGACQCPKCGQWYNIFGQELNPPSMWEE